MTDICRTLSPATHLVNSIQQKVEGDESLKEALEHSSLQPLTLETKSKQSDVCLILGNTHSCTLHLRHHLPPMFLQPQAILS